MWQTEGTTTWKQHNRRLAQIRQIDQKLRDNPEMAEEMAERMQTLMANLQQVTGRLDNQDAALAGRLHDAQRLTNAVQTLNNHNNVIDPQHKAYFSQLELFRGHLGDDFAQWFRRFEDVAIACGWNEDRRLQILPALLTENAHEIFHVLPDAEKDTYPHLRTALAERLQPAENRHFKATELHARRQGPLETVDDYSSAVQRLARGAYSTYPEETRNQLLLDAFLSGLKTQLRQLVTLSNPNTFPIALATARRLEAQNALTANSAVSDSMAALCQVLPVLASNPSTSFSNRNDPDSRSHSENRGNGRNRDRDYSRDSSTDRLSREVDQLRRDMGRMRSDNNPRQHPFSDNRNFRPHQFTTDGRPICGYCSCVGHTRPNCRQLERNYGNNPNYRPLLSIEIGLHQTETTRLEMNLGGHLIVDPLHRNVRRLIDLRHLILTGHARNRPIGIDRMASSDRLAPTRRDVSTSKTIPPL